jgi:hypothetical protein
VDLLPCRAADLFGWSRHRERLRFLRPSSMNSEIGRSAVEDYPESKQVACAARVNIADLCVPDRSDLSVLGVILAGEHPISPSDEATDSGLVFVSRRVLDLSPGLVGACLAGTSNPAAYVNQRSSRGRSRFRFRPDSTNEVAALPPVSDQHRKATRPTAIIAALWACYANRIAPCVISVSSPVTVLPIPRDTATVLPPA